MKLFELSHALREKRISAAKILLDICFFSSPMIRLVEETGNGWRLHCLWALPSRWPFEDEQKPDRPVYPPLGTKMPRKWAGTHALQSQLRRSLSQAHTRIMGGPFNPRLSAYPLVRSDARRPLPVCRG